MKICPAPGCRLAIAAHQFACNRHWSAIGGEARGALVSAYYHLRTEALSLARVTEIERWVRSQMGWPVTEPEPERTHRRGRCVTCNQFFVSAPIAGTGDTALFVEVRGPIGPSTRIYHLIGFEAVAAEAAPVGSYARFKEHQCRLATRPTPEPQPSAYEIPTPSA